MKKERLLLYDDLGLIYGRDAIYLDELRFKDGFSCLILQGEFNGSLCANLPGDVWVKYTIEFPSILELTMTGVDFYPDKGSVSSFERILNSDKLAVLGRRFGASEKMREGHQHFVFYTYDEVFEVVSDGYHLEVGESRGQKKSVG